MAGFQPFNHLLPAITLVFFLGVSGVVRATELTDDDGDGSPAGEDCDDTDDDVYPGAFDRWYDGLDADCDGADDFDRDQDGWPYPEDCSDIDPEVHPEADETLDEVDQNCDGYTDPHFAISPHGGAACAAVPGGPPWAVLGTLWFVRRRWSR